MSYITERYDIEGLPNQSLAIAQCGWQKCHGGHGCGPFVYRHYAMHFITKGKGVYRLQGQSYNLGPGDGFLIIPGISNYYVADDKDPWEYIYASFYGADADTLIHCAGLDEENITFSFALDDSMVKDLNAMHAASRSYDAKGYDVIGYFLLVMSRLIKDYSKKNNEVFLPEHYIKKAGIYIENNYPYNITVSDIAKYVGIDRTYLYRIFRDKLHLSVSEYLINYRLERAVELMKHDNLSMQEIALSTGFYDVSHFSKCFNSIYGTSPGKYRKEKIK
ncbi:MAG: AraC family transcriptional regulator [Bacillota bacterium]|nr:AraC family transcriptional regulator [Bacillota bacterium]